MSRLQPDYDVRRADEGESGLLFVLDVDRDPLAEAALRVYADGAIRAGGEALELGKALLRYVNGDKESYSE